MKKILPIILICAFLYSILGFYLNFEIAQYRIKKEVKSRIIKNLPVDELTLVKISFSDKKKITWMEEGREFRYKGEMFDVVTIKKGKDTTYYYCFSDVRESKLLARLDKLVKDQTDNSQSRANQKKQEINYFFHKILFTQCLVETSVLYFNYPSSYKSWNAEVLSPPPRIPNTVL
jgi:hypothetical protein